MECSESLLSLDFTVNLVLTLLLLIATTHISIQPKFRCSMFVLPQLLIVVHTQDGFLCWPHLAVSIKQWSGVCLPVQLFHLNTSDTQLGSEPDVDNTFWPFFKVLSHTHTHAHSHTFNGPLSGTTRESKNQSVFSGARDSEWQWHQLGHMQICTSPQADTNRMPFLPPNQLVIFYLLCIF